MVYTETPFCCVTLSDIVAVVRIALQLGLRWWRWTAQVLFFCGLGLPGHTSTLVAGVAVESDKVWDLASILQAGAAHFFDGT